MTKALQKSSKRKKKYDIFLQDRTIQNEKKYKQNKALFEVLKEKSKKISYAQQNMKKSWPTINKLLIKLNLLIIIFHK